VIVRPKRESDGTSEIYFQYPSTTTEGQRRELWDRAFSRAEAASLSTEANRGECFTAFSSAPGRVRVNPFPSARRETAIKRQQEKHTDCFFMLSPWSIHPGHYRCKY
jgi:hypothetical protein